MTFVPFVPPIGDSSRSHDLGKRLADIIEAYRREHPDLSRHEVRHALRFARRQQEGLAFRLAPILAPVLAALVAALIAVLGHGPRASWNSGPVIAVIMVAVAIIGLVAVLSRR